MQLNNGSQVCIVGGGPAGSFAAIHLLRLAQERGLDLSVLIFEPRDFTRPGQASCKGCAGILSAELVCALGSYGLDLPQPVVQSELRAYVVHINGHVACIEQPNPQRRILSIYRGRGPGGQGLQASALDSFDGYLLAEACVRGARHIRARVQSVEWDQVPVVKTQDQDFRADLLVLATGVNRRCPLGPAFGYRSPQTSTMVQAEIPRPENWPEHKVAGFFGAPPELVFGAIVPKRRYLGVSLLWRGAVANAAAQFYQANQQALSRFFPALPENVCHCAPRIVVRPAQVYFGDHWVAVGDAAISRLYKDGIHSAFLTTQVAMQSVIEHGVARQAFEKNYAPFCQALAADNRYGKLMFALSSQVMRASILAQVFVGCIRAESKQSLALRICSRLVWGMLTGDESYQDLFWLAFKPKSLLSLGRTWLQALGLG